MAWNNYNNNTDDDGKFSEFNSAGLKMKRLDKILSMINEINSNLRAFNIENGVYNYQLKFSLCDSLFLEIESKLTKEEKEAAHQLREALIKFMKEYNIQKFIRKNVYKDPTPVIDEVTFRILENFLFKYEILVRDQQDKHGMDTAYGDEASLF